MSDMVTQEAGQETLPAMTKNEALRTNDAIKSGIKTLRALLLDMRDRKGWLALGYSSFEEYGKTELGYEKARVYQLVNAAIIENTLKESTIVDSPAITESHLRPLAPLSDEDRRKVWQEAIAQAEEENRKLTAKMVQEAVDRLNAEKQELQGQLELAQLKTEEWREQANKNLKIKRNIEADRDLKALELATLRKSVETTAQRMASDQIDEIKLQKIELEQKLKTLRKQQDEAVETRTKEALKAQQDEINRREAQLQTIERKLADAKAQMQAVDDQARVLAHFERCATEIKQHLNDLSAAVQLALDPDYTDHLPAEYVPLFEKLAREMREGAKGIEQMLGVVDVRRLEVAVNE